MCLHSNAQLYSFHMSDTGLFQRTATFCFICFCIIWKCVRCFYFPGGSVCKESICNAGDLGSIPGLERSPRGGHGNPLSYSCLENPHGQRSLAWGSPWGHKEGNTTEWLSTGQHRCFYKLKIFHWDQNIIYGRNFLFQENNIWQCLT